MFIGEKTAVFWVGLLILGMSSMVLFSTIWYILLASLSSQTTYFSWGNWVPPIAGAITFLLIGLYMMKSGTRREKESEPATKLL
jgi:hypothetical protein